MNFTNDKRHFCQKGCLFDYVRNMNLIRYLVLHNFICYNCRSLIGDEDTQKVLKCLDSEHIYSTSIERHPARMSAQLGFNLSLTRGIYKSKKEMLLENFNKSFVEKTASTVAVMLIILVAFFFGVESYVPKGD